MILKNAELFDADFNLIRADLATSGNRIAQIAPDIADDDVVNLSGCILLPGFVDIHIHGCAGHDACDATRDALSAMAAHLVRHGVTAFCPTTMTIAPEALTKAVRTVRGCISEPPEGASILGVNLEGPYISVHKKGAQMAEYVRKPDLDQFMRLYEACGGGIKLVDIAPETEDAHAFIEATSKLCRVSLAHSEADYDEAKAAFDCGVRHATHLFNAMTGLTHRAPGAVGAILDDERVTAELICDGQHIHPAVLRTAFKVLGDRAVVVSDSMRAAGLPDGVSELGGQKVYVKNGTARLADGTLAGSITNLHDELKNLIAYGIPLRQAVRSVTINPAAAVNADAEIGSLCVGKQADIVALDSRFEIKMVICRGVCVVNKL